MEYEFLMIALSVTAAATILSLVLYAVMRRRFNHDIQGSQAELEALFDLVDSLNDEAAVRIRESEKNARRIAWLEAKVRSSARESRDEVVLQKTKLEPPKLNITERRHRVLALSQRGQSPETIAETLGMMAGEVELIVNLNRSMAA